MGSNHYSEGDLAKSVQVTVTTIKALHKYLLQLTPYPEEKVKDKYDLFNSNRLRNIQGKHYGGFRNHQLDQVN